MTQSALRKSKRHYDEFSEDYRREVFLIWYGSQRCHPNHLHKIVPFNVEGKKPTVYTLTQWVKTDYTDEADRLDKLVQEQIDNQAVAEKVEMVNRHAAVSKEMQDMAIKYLKEHEINMTPGVAVRLLVESVRIERESRGLPSLITEISKSSNEQLLEKVKNIFSSAPMLEEAND